MEYKPFEFIPVRIDNLTFKEVQYHRNGVCGDGFHCAVVNDHENGDMLITYFEIKDHVCCAVYKLSMLPNIRFMENSWRGDHYVDQMKKAIAEYNKQLDSHFKIGK
jgi:hypothetical protein